MNTASQNLEHHLGVLGEKLQHATAYELALSYFLDEFAGDAQFVLGSEPEESLHLRAVVARAAEKVLGEPAEFDHFKAFRLPQFGFNHGNAVLAGRVVLFFYFEKLETGLVALIPGVRGETEVARFRFPGGLANPKNN